MPKPKNTSFITLRGKVNYAKVLGAPVDNYEETGKEWTVDFILGDPNAANAVKAVQEDTRRLKALGIADRIKQKEKYLDGQPFLSLRQRATKADGTANDPIAVTDVTGADWPQNKLLGAGTVVDIKLRVADYGKGFRQGVYVSGIRVLDLVPYNRPVFNEIDEDDPYYKAAKVKAAEAATAEEQRVVEDDEAEEQIDANDNAAEEDDDDDSPIG